MSYNVVNGLRVDFKVRPPKNGKKGPRVAEHSVTIPSEDLAKFTDFIQNHGLEMHGQVYKYQKSDGFMTGENPPVWAGIAIVDNQVLTCFIREALHLESINT